MGPTPQKTSLVHEHNERSTYKSGKAKMLSVFFRHVQIQTDTDLSQSCVLPSRIVLIHASPEAFRATRHCMENTDGGQTVHGDHHSPALRRLIQRDHLVEVSTKPKRSSSVSIIQQHDQLPRVRTMAWFPDSVWEDRNPKPKMLHTLGGLCTGLSLGPPVQSSHR
jgi:hypothetical protein